MSANAQALPPYLSPQQLADLIGVPLKTVYDWNHRGGAPAITRLGQLVRYARADVEAWLAQRREPARPAPKPLKAETRRAATRRAS